VRKLSLFNKHNSFLFVVIFVFFTLTFFFIPFSINAQEGEQDIWSTRDALGQSAESGNQRQIEVEEGVVKGEAGNVNSDSQFANLFTAAQALSQTILLGSKSDSPEIESFFGPGAVNLMAGLVDDMYDYQPASSQRYVAYLLNSAKIPVAQAQGIGASSLDPIMEIWTTFRNLSYYLFVLMFLIIGVLIMFRHKINGQTVVTVQQAIPNIIVALIFVTFSYAIGGLLIDVMYLVMSFIAGVFTNSTNIMSSNIFALGAQYVTGGFSQTNDAISAIITQVSGANVVAGLGGLTVGFIVAIALLYGVVKLFIELLKSYVSIILLITFSPVILMMGAIPGQNSFSSWIKNLVGNLAAFPVVLLVLVVSEAINAHGITSGGFAPPFLLGPTISGGVSASSGNALAGLVGIGMLLATPEIVKKAKDALGAKEGIMGELAGAAWSRFKQGQEGIKKGASVAGTVAGGLGYGAIGAALGSSDKVGFGPLTGALGGAAIGIAGKGKPIAGAKKVGGVAFRAANQWGELNENLQKIGIDFATPAERFALSGVSKFDNMAQRVTGKKSKDAIVLRDFIEKMQRQRQVRDQYLKGRIQQPPGQPSDKNKNKSVRQDEFKASPGTPAAPGKAKPTVGSGRTEDTTESV